MFVISRGELSGVLRDFGIDCAAASVTELERYTYEKNDPASREVRVILKAVTEDGRALVIRFRSENDFPAEHLEGQSRFAELLRANGVAVPRQYVSSGVFAKPYTIGGYDVTVTIEDFMEGEVRSVDETVAEKAGRLLAKTHDISEQNDFHVPARVLFDPFTKNDLFFYEAFAAIAPGLTGDDLALHRRISAKYGELMDALSPLRRETRYAVQGDMSDCNLFFTSDGELGLFDFNWCADNDLFCDAVMQALFFSRLMDYPEEIAGDSESVILPAFLRGYESVRPFTDVQRRYFPPLYAVVTAFSGALKLEEAHKKGDRDEVRRMLDTIWERLHDKKGEYYGQTDIR